MLKKIQIKDLRLGMFVAEMDISWVKSPFFRHKRLIVNQEDIELLKKAGVENITIDLSKSQLKTGTSPEVNQVEVVVAEDSKNKSSVTIEEKPASPKPKISLRKEFNQAQKIQKEIVNAVAEINQCFESGGQVPVEKVSPVVEKTLESIDNNSQALMALLHEGRSDSRLLSHSFGVFALVLLLTSHLDYKQEDQTEIGLAALMHDAGWSKLPSQMMSKGKSYTKAEKMLVMQHIPILQKMLDTQENVSEAVRVVIEQHHEFLDGSGYPKQLKGDDIHSWARLLTVCNEYDEMVHGLGENPGMTPQNALSELYHLAEKGKIDSFFASSLISLLGVYPLGSAVELSDARLGVIVELNIAQPMNPRVLVFYDENLKTLKAPIRINLATSELKILRVLDTHGKDKTKDPKGLLVFSGEMIFTGGA